MKYFKFFTVLLYLILFQNAIALDQKDEEKINHIIDGYVDVWNNHAGRGFASNYSENSDFINIFGEHFRGKEEVENRHIEILNTFLKDSKFTVTDLELREINPNLVIAFVQWRVNGFQQSCSEHQGPGDTVEGIFSHVFVKEKDSWEIAATQNTLSK